MVRASSSLHRLGRLVRVAVALGCGALVVTCLVPLVPVWPFVLTEHFRVQFLGGGAVLVAAAAALAMRGYFDAALLGTLVHLLAIAPELCLRPRPIPRDGVPLRVLVVNVHTRSTSFDAVRALIDDVRPDVVGLVEADQRWIDGVAPAVAGFAGRLEEPRDDNFGLALYTRAPLVGTVERLDAAWPSAVAALPVGGATVTLLLTHPLPPVSAAALDAQQVHFDAVARRVRTLAGPVVVMGDLNATPWSRPYRRLLAGSGLCDSRAGFGIQATFPSSSFLLRIPIDHLLASCSVGITGRRVERHVGSDHLPVVVDLVVPPAGSAER